MHHPDKIELTRYAADEPIDPPLVLHMETCLECSAEAERLRVALSAVIVSTTLAADAGPDCLDEQAVAALAESGLPPAARDACVAHLASCARCRVAVASVAYARSVVGVASELGTIERAARAPWQRYTLALGAAAAVAALVFVSRPPAPVPAPVHREGSAAAGTAPATISPTGPTRAVRVLRWHSVRGADRYRVTLFDGDGTVLYETAISDTVAPLPEDVQIEAGRSYYWMVAARTDFDRWDTSSLAEFSVDGAER